VIVDDEQYDIPVLIRAILLRLRVTTFVLLNPV
jgi:hypothetical protein